MTRSQLAGDGHRQRAIHTEDKELRYQAILDAAEPLLHHATGRGPSMADVADEAGLAKGTVYLYFPSKNELLLALLERDIDGFFSALAGILEGSAPLSIDQILTLMQRKIFEPPLFLPLAGRCFGWVGQSLPIEVARGFNARMAGRLERAGGGLERHFQGLRPGDGVALLRHSYALILGFWQTARGAATRCAPRPAGTAIGDYAALARSDAQDLDRALRALWEGTLNRDETRATQHAPEARNNSAV
ncbi:MAG: TetR/AcrR family transcriptional regulator [Pseudomonadota bacterium]|nr:TetR/AcrR family transcriptional regulator [Pseudomonadota bacterium]